MPSTIAGPPGPGTSRSWGSGGDPVAARGRSSKGRGGWLRGLRGWVAAGITAVCLVSLALNAQLPPLQEAARRANYELLGLAFIVSLLTIVCKAARWRILYPAEARPALGLAVAAIAVGQVANWAVPARLGEVLRVGLVSTGRPERGGDEGPAVATSVGVLIVEKVLDGAMLLATVALLAILGGLPAWVSALGLLAVAATCVVGVALAVLLRGRPRERWVPARVVRLHPRIPVLARQLGALGEGISAWLSPGAVVQAVVWSAAAWGLGALINVLVLSSLDLGQGLVASLAVLAGLYGAAVIPALPGRMGIFQYVCVLVLVPFGVDFDGALAFALALYSVVYLPPLALGLLSIALVGSLPRRLVARSIGPALARPSRNS